MLQKNNKDIVWKQTKHRICMSVREKDKWIVLKVNKTQGICTRVNVEWSLSYVVTF